MSRSIMRIIQLSLILVLVVSLPAFAATDTGQEKPQDVAKPTTTDQDSNLKVLRGTIQSVDDEGDAFTLVTETGQTITLQADDEFLDSLEPGDRVVVKLKGGKVQEITEEE